MTAATEAGGGGEDDWRGEPLTIESLCMNCYQNVSSSPAANESAAIIAERVQTYGTPCCCRARRRCCSPGFRTSGSSQCAPLSARTAARGASVLAAAAIEPWNLTGASPGRRNRPSQVLPHAVRPQQKAAEALPPLQEQRGAVCRRVRGDRRALHAGGGRRRRAGAEPAGAPLAGRTHPAAKIDL